MNEQLRIGELHTLSVARLKAELQRCDLSVRGRKSELVQRLRWHLTNQMDGQLHIEQ